MKDKNKDSTLSVVRGIILNNIIPSEKYFIVKPTNRSYIGYKVALKYPLDKTTIISEHNLCILKLEIPEGAKIIYSVHKKCRCDKAKVLRIYDFASYTMLGDLRKCHSVITEAYSMHDPSFVYKLGEMISVDDFDDDASKICSSGIHFFRNIKDIVNYITN